MLAAKRFDVFIMDKRAGMHTYNTQYKEQLSDSITYYTQPLLSLDYSVRFSGDGERSQRLLNIFNSALKELKDAGVVNQYYENFEAGFYQASKSIGPK